MLHTHVRAPTAHWPSSLRQFSTAPNVLRPCTPPMQSSLMLDHAHYPAQHSISHARTEGQRLPWQPKQHVASVGSHSSLVHSLNIASSLVAMAAAAALCIAPCQAAPLNPEPETATASSPPSAGQESSPPAAALAADAPVPPIPEQVPVKISLKNVSADDLEQLGSSPTLYLTARPSNYKLPFASRKMVLSKATLDAFPVKVLLGTVDDLLLPSDQYLRLSQLLDHQDVVVSARLDRDGDPNTRDAEDLVGRGLASWDAVRGGRGEATVALEGRGMFGKFITARQTQR